MIYKDLKLSYENTSCRFCKYIVQYCVNWFVLGDHLVNCLSGGDSNETLSTRIARARRDGKQWPIKVCDTLSYIVRIISFGKINRDHCSHALDNTDSSSREIWNWSTGKINNPPISEVDIVHDHSVGTIELEPIRVHGVAGRLDVHGNMRPFRASAILKSNITPIIIDREIILKISVKPKSIVD